ncbi:MAG: hypothetical protein ACO25F_06485 [Erythrobacter sp.]
MPRLNRLAACTGLLAGMSMAATPLAAADVASGDASLATTFGQSGGFNAESLKAHNHRYWRHRDRIDAGDVLAGVLIIGGIAAIANAASKADRQDRYRERDYRYDRPEYREDRDRRRSGEPRGIDRAVDMCVAEVERDVRIDTVDSVERNGEGWRVAGTIFNGDRFTCSIGSDGRIDNVDYGDSFAAAAVPADNQHSDDRYRAAWAQHDNAPSSQATTPGADGKPAYPGGPVDGDLEADGADDRYGMAEAPTI